jgi:uncharacterized protein YjeT (DUF2065 family)
MRNMQPRLLTLGLEPVVLRYSGVLNYTWPPRLLRQAGSAFRERPDNILRRSVIVPLLIRETRPARMEAIRTQVICVATDVLYLNGRIVPPNISNWTGAWKEAQEYEVASRQLRSHSA